MSKDATRKSMSQFALKKLKEELDKQTIYINESLSSLNKFLIQMRNGECMSHMFQGNLLKVMQKILKKETHILFVFTISSHYPEESYKTLKDGHSFYKIDFNILPQNEVNIIFFIVINFTLLDKSIFILRIKNNKKKMI